MDIYRNTMSKKLWNSPTSLNSITESLRAHQCRVPEVSIRQNYQFGSMFVVQGQYGTYVPSARDHKEHGSRHTSNN
jgi:hypothetical protein